MQKNVGRWDLTSHVTGGDGLSLCIPGGTLLVANSRRSSCPKPQRHGPTEHVGVYTGAVRTQIYTAGAPSRYSWYTQLDQQTRGPDTTARSWQLCACNNVRSTSARPKTATHTNPISSLHLRQLRRHGGHLHRRLPPHREAQPEEAVQRSPDDLRRRTVPAAPRDVSGEFGENVLMRDVRLCEGPEGVRDEPRGVEEDGRARGVVDAERDR